LKRRLALLATALITVGVLVAVVWLVDVRLIGSALSRTDPLWIAGAVVVSALINVVLGAEAIRFILQGLGVRISRSVALRATVGNLALQGVLPAATGNLSRAAWLVKTQQTPVAETTAAAVLTVIFKVTSFGILAGLGWAWMGGSAMHGAGLALGLVAALVAVVIARKTASDWVALTAGFGFAGSMVGSELVVFYLILRALGVVADPALILAWMPLALIGAKLPLTVLGVGTREALVVVLFTGLADPAVLAAAALLHSFVVHVAPSVIGTALTFGFLREALNPSD